MSKPGVALTAKCGASIAFSGAVRISVTLLRHHTQNDLTPIQQVTAYWWLLRHSALDLFAKSVYLSSGSALLPGTTSSTEPSTKWCWRSMEEVQSLKGRIRTKQMRELPLVCMAITPPPPPPPQSMRVIVSRALCLWIKFAYSSEEWQWFIWTQSLRTRIWKNNRQSGQREIAYPAKLIRDNFRSVDRGHDPKNWIWNDPMYLV